MSYSNEIFENIAIGKDVITVSATDIDSGKFYIRDTSHFLEIFHYLIEQHFCGYAKYAKTSPALFIFSIFFAMYELAS